MIRRLATIATLAAVGAAAISSPAAAVDFKKDGGTLWRSGHTPGGSVTVNYGGVTRTKSIKADKCKVIRAPGRKTVTGSFVTPKGPIVIGSTTYANSTIDQSPSVYLYRCKKDIEGTFKPFFASNAPGSPFHHFGVNGEADNKGNVYFAPSGIAAGNSYSVEWVTSGQRKTKANACGIIVLKSSTTYNHGSIATVDGDNISSLTSGAVPKCRNGVIVPG